MANIPLWQWRQMRRQDMDIICRIAALCYPDLPESAAVLAEKQALSPQSCFALAAADNSGEIGGYLLAHPWRRGHIPQLNRLLQALPPKPDCLYLHDLALAPSARGRGLAQAGAAKLTQQAEALGFRHIALTSVHNSAAFWQRLGFAPCPLPRQKDGGSPLAHYGAGAVYMGRAL